MNLHIEPQATVEDFGAHSLNETTQLSLISDQAEGFQNNDILRRLVHYLSCYLIHNRVNENISLALENYPNLFLSQAITYVYNDKLIKIQNIILSIKSCLIIRMNVVKNLKFQNAYIVIT